ncbi:MAG: SdpI family protein [Cyclobacteriaceae bacterium]
MLLEYKLIIIFIGVGILNILLRKNRNWIFGYRSPRAIKTHKSFAYANRIYGSGLIALGIIYFTLIFIVDVFDKNDMRVPQIVFLISYFLVLITTIEIMLSKTYKSDNS